MRIPVSVKAIEEIGDQNKEHQSPRLPYLLGARSTTVTVGDVPGLRSTSPAKPSSRHDVLTGGIYWATDKHRKST